LGHSFFGGCRQGLVLHSIRVVQVSLIARTWLDARLAGGFAADQVDPSIAPLRTQGFTGKSAFICISCYNFSERRLQGKSARRGI
jgi:hypothetical protein